MSENDFTLPPASFEFLIWSLVIQAEVHMGIRRMPGDEEKAEKNLPAARHAIDMLGVLQEKTKGNLTLEEQRLVDNSLTELRFRFLEASKPNG